MGVYVMYGGALYRTDELYHHGIKGMKWGVRRYQYTDGSLTPAGKKRYSDETGGRNGFGKTMAAKVSHVVGTAKTVVTGRQCVDGYLKANIELSRIQTKENFENFAFYATYEKHDVEAYTGLFGKNLLTRADGKARHAEKVAEKTGNKEDAATAKKLREEADNMNIYQLKIGATKKLKIPSDENAGNITAKLLKESDFKNNLEASILDSMRTMKRPTQQVLFKQALSILKQDPDSMSVKDKIALYKAFNLTLVNHNPQEIAAQDRFYGEMKKKGYSALLDYNDKEFSSYHAKRPVIVFDVDSVRLQSVAQVSPKTIEKLYSVYNTERILKDIPANTTGLIMKYGDRSLSACQRYVKNMTTRHLNRAGA